MAKGNSGENFDVGDGTGDTTKPVVGDNGADNGNGGETVNPATASNSSSEPVGDSANGNAADSGAGRKRRSDIGKRRGPRSGNSNKGSSARLEIEGVSTLLLSTHAMLAGLTRTTELQIDKAEADHLAKGIADVAAFYDTVISPKTLAWINLTQIAGIIYGPRMFLISARRQQERAARRAARPAQPQQPMANGAVPRSPQPAPTNDGPVGIMPSDLNAVEFN